MITLFATKFVESSLNTLKSVFLNKNRNFLSALVKAIGTGFSFVAIGFMIADPSFSTILIICLATFLGSYLPSLFLNKPTVAAA
jgi:hypothetical protein